MKLPNNTKAIVAAVISALGPVANDAATNPQGITGSTGIVSAVFAALGYGVTWYARNGAAVKGGASGLVVTLKTDASAFLAAFASGLPTLVETAAKAALDPASKVDPAPAPAEVVSDPGAGAGTPDAAPAVTPATDPIHPVAQP